MRCRGIGLDLCKNASRRFFFQNFNVMYRLLDRRPITVQRSKPSIATDCRVFHER